MSPRLSEHWLNGRLVVAWDDAAALERGAPGVRHGSAPGSEPSAARGCYTTARVRDGVARHGAAHARRLALEAAVLGIGQVPEDAVLELFETLGRHAFGSGEGVIRVEARMGQAGAAELRGVPRALGPDRATWSACVAPFSHGGPGPWPGAKLLGDPIYERARALAGSEEVDEVLLFDAAGRLVEGARSNLIAVDDGGRLCTPDLALGAVAGIALAAVRQGFPELRTVEIRRDGLDTLRELIAVNAVRGARSIVSVDGRAVGCGAAGSWSQRLDELLFGAWSRA